jgi:hypothetical protein
MLQVILLLAKLFFFGVLFFLFLMLINLVFAELGKLFTFQKHVALAYSIIISIIYAYLYSFWGAYLKSITDIYIKINYPKWLLILICICSALPWMKYGGQQSLEEKAKINPNESKEENFAQSITVIALAVNYFIIISYIIFLFTSNLHNILFFNLPDYLAKLFVK